MAAKKKTSRSPAKKSPSRGKSAAGSRTGARKASNGAARLTPSAQKAVDDVREQAQAYMQPTLKKLANWARDVM